MELKIRRAERRHARLRLALIGPAGSGKTYTALRIARLISPDKPVLVLDSEHGSAEKYAGYHDPEAGRLDFDIVTPDSFHPTVYIEAARMAEAEGYGVLILDSLSHAWAGRDGALELVDRAQARQKTSNAYSAWRDVTPLHHRMIDAILTTRVHVIATMRARMEYAVTQDSAGRLTVRRLGLQPVQRDGIEYEFDVVGELDADHTLVVTKTRCPALVDKIYPMPGSDLADALRAWLSEGVEQPECEPAPVLAVGEIRERLSAAAIALRQSGDKSAQAHQLLEQAREAYRSGDVQAMVVLCNAIARHVATETHTWDQKEASS